MAKSTKRTWLTSKGETRTAWRVVYIDETGVRHQPQFPTKREAEAFRIEIEGQLASGLHRSDGDKITLGELSIKFLERCESRMNRGERMSQKMFVVYRGHVHNHIIDIGNGISGIKLSELTARRVGDFRDRLRSNGVTVPTARKILSTLHAIMAYAVSQDLVAVNTVSGVRIDGPRDDAPKRIVPPTKSELTGILEASEGKIRDYIIFASTTGLRAGEQWALRWGDLDLDAREIMVNRRVDVYGNEGPPKSVAGRRTVPMSGHLANSLRHLRLASDYSGNSDLVFPNGSGRFLSHDNMIKRLYKPVLAAARVSGINWHSLRHFAISTWIEAGLEPKAVQTFAGHSGLQITMDRYGHLFAKDDHGAAMDAIAIELFGR